jgi:peptide/nickel transport system permease protein
MAETADTAGSVVVIIFYLTVVFADFLAYSDPLASEAQRSLIPPQSINWFDEGKYFPHIYAMKGRRDPITFKRVYAADPNDKLPVVFFAQGFEYKMFGFIPMDRHFLGVEA